MSGNKKSQAALVVMRRELAAYFSGPVAYIVTGLFLVFSGMLFFTSFFFENRAELRGFFSLLPLLFSFFVPALTMRLFSEELRSGSVETLMTLPVDAFDVVVGKFLAAWASAAALLAPTLVYALTVGFLGDLEAGPLVGGYAGALLLAAAYSAVGVFASASTKNQIVAFFVAFAVCAALTLVGAFLVFLPGPAVGFVEFLSAEHHFQSISRGIVDSRDLLYFVTVAVVFLGMAVSAVDAQRRAS